MQIRKIGVFKFRDMRHDDPRLVEIKPSPDCGVRIRKAVAEFRPRPGTLPAKNPAAPEKETLPSLVHCGMDNRRQVAATQMFCQSARVLEHFVEKRFPLA